MVPVTKRKNALNQAFVRLWNFCQLKLSTSSQYVHLLGASKTDAASFTFKENFICLCLNGSLSWHALRHWPHAAQWVVTNQRPAVPAPPPVRVRALLRTHRRLLSIRRAIRPINLALRLQQCRRVVRAQAPTAQALPTCPAAAREQVLPALPIAQAPAAPIRHQALLRALRAPEANQS